MWQGAALDLVILFDVPREIIMVIDHKARARAAWPYLVKQARLQQNITYGSIAGLLGLHHRSARWFLSVIQEYCSANSLPPLQVLVVNKRTGIPGSGYVASKRSEKALQKAIRKTCSFSWPKKAPF